jgi:cell division protein FtsQ
VAGTAWVLLGDRVFVVRSVTVTGTHLVSTSQVIAAADVPIGTPLSRVNAGAVTTRVEAIRQVASATVTLNWPDHVTIAISERVPVMAVRMAGGGYDLVDPAGVIVRWASAKPAGMPLFSTLLSGAALRSDPGVSAIAAVLAELSPAVARTVRSVSVAQVPTGSAGSFAQAEQVTLSATGGKTIIWGDPSNAAAKNRELEILLRNGDKYVNVSAPGTVVAR